MTRTHLWWLAGAMAAAIGCGDTPPVTPPPADVQPADVDMGDVVTPTDKVTPTDNVTPEDNVQPPADADDVVVVDATDDTMTACTNPGEIRCGDTCVDPQASNANCGMCGRACATGESCRMGACMPDMPCPMGQTRCGTTCVETATDATNCGSCGNACAMGQTCSGGMCSMPEVCTVTGQIRCGGACIDPQTDAANCGTCGTACPMGQSCRMGACAATVDCSMMPGTTACAGTCVNLQTDAANCGMCGTACMTGEVCTAGVCGTMACPTGQTRCGTACVNLQIDPANCMACGRACVAGQTCAAGVCTGGMMMCGTGQTMCPGGACANLMTDPTNCGACGTACATGQMCTGGMCVTGRVCPTGQTDCTPTAMTMTCVNLQTSGTNCGACGTVCPTGTTCTAGSCACATGQTLCGRTCVNTMTDRANCGACGTACPAGQSCTSGRCACPTGQTACSGACVNTMTDAANCGMCGTACAGGQTCTGGRCACPTGQISCGSGTAARCTNTMTDRANCGTCATVCATGQTCTGGRCACPTGQSVCGTGTAAACFNLMTSATNCGMCGRACPTGQSCAGGMCVGRPPANDTRAGATVISLTTPAQTIAADTTSARHDVMGSCACTSTGNDVFYRFALTQPEVVYADTLGAAWDTSLFFLDAAGAPVVATGTNVTCNDDSNGAGFCPTLGVLQSQVAARLAAGTYYLVLSGCGAGTAQIHFQHVPAGVGTSTRIAPTTASQNISGAVAGTGTSTNGTCCSGGPENSAWWVTCPSTATATLQATSCSATTGANVATYDIELAVYSALRGTSSFNVCNDDVGGAFVCGAGASLGAALPATTTNQAGLNSLLIDSCTGTGTYTVRYSLGTCPTGSAFCGGACTDTNFDENNCGGCDRRCASGSVCSGGVCYARPANDTRAGAIAISLTPSQTILSANNAAAANNISVTGCACTNGRDVFYSFTLTRREVVYADTVGSTRDTSLFFLNSAGAYVGATSGVPNGSTCNDDGGLSGCATGLQSQVMAAFNAGTYYLVLSGCGEGGPATVRFQHLPLGNGPVTLLPAGTSAVVMGTTSGTGTLTSACCSGGPENNHLWYTCQGAVGGAFTASTCGRATWDTELDQRSAARTSPGVSVCNDDAGGTCTLRSTIGSTIPAGPGIHTLYVDGCGSGAGAYSVQYTRP